MHKPITSICDAATTATHQNTDAWSNHLSLSGYQITEQLYAGSRTLVYRAIRESSRQQVVLKLLRNEMPTFSELVQFRNQYAIMRGITDSNCNISGVIQPYSLEDCGNGFVLVMEDFGGISLSQFTQRQSLGIPDFLDIALQLADILHYLYQHRVIHKDIKPANILIHPQIKKVKLIDFSISSLLPRETQEIQNLNVLEGTLAYLAPEQTGRMNRGIDYRSDFYSLGVTFYQLLGGQLPFQSDDPMELIHCHLAKIPQPLHEANSSVPVVLSQIVARLMAKNAEDRYQSALGLKRDLEICWQQWHETGTISEFKIAQEDRCDRFIIPEKLYGRKTEVAALLAAFDRVAGGEGERGRGGEGENYLASSQSHILNPKPQIEMMLVAGFSGIGKTAVINEVHKPIVRQRGYFIKGKYDQFQRNIPFSAFVQAFRDLMAQLLGESKAQLAQWRTKILQAAGENGQVIIDVIPELEIIIGKQPPVPELSGSAAQNRFNLVFQKFIQVFTTKEHPLVMFLDDLQWADSASLALLKLLLSETETGYLLVLGAYRDNEVFLAHPLMLTLEEIQKAAATINTITLTPLNQDDINQLVADTLFCSTELAQPLAELTYQKTQGNPFFATQFLKALYGDRAIAFNLEEHHWECDITQVKAAALTSDVVEFMAAQLQKLPVKTQKMLNLAACIGNSFDLTTLAIVSEKSPVDTAADLWKALQEGLILPISETYKFFQSGDAVSTQEISVPYRFLHDRVQQAAYSLIAEEQRASIHLKMGQLLLDRTSDIERDNKLFDIVNHLNRGSRLIAQPTEQEQIAQLNLLAAKKAKSATAYESAITYAIAGIALLTPDCWQSQYELALVLHELAAENAFLARDFEQMEHWSQTVLQQAKTPLDRVKIYEIKIQAYVSQHRLLDAIALAKQILNQFSVQIPDRTTQEDIQQGFQHTGDQFAKRTIEEWLNLPPMTAAEPLAAMRIVSCVAPAVYITAPSLYPLLILSQVNASIQHGNAPLSAFFYASYGLLLNGVLEDMEAADRAGKLALGVLEKLNAKEVESRTRLLVGALIIHGTTHLRESLLFLSESYRIGLETGDVNFAGYAVTHHCQYSYFSSQELETLERDIQRSSQVLVNFKQAMMGNYCQLFRQVVLNLSGKAKNPCVLVGDVYDEAQFLPQLLTANDQLGLHFFYLHKLILGYLFGDTTQSLSDIATAGRQYLAAGAGFITVPIFYFYDSLAALSGDFSADSELSEAKHDDFIVRLQQVVENQARLQKWAHHAPMNHLHKWHLVEAEKHRVLGNKMEAGDRYDRAISLAKENGYIQEEALANELAAKFYLDWGKEKVASGYMQEAYYCYAKWGAKAKIKDLETRYPQLLAPILQKLQIADRDRDLTTSINTLISTERTVSSNSSSSISNFWDLRTVLKAAQALYREINLDKQQAILMQIIVENSGSDKAALFLDRDGELETAVEYLEHTIHCRSPQPVDKCRDFPTSIIHYVERTLETVITDATTHPSIVGDRYFTEHQPQSLLCTPILNRGKLIGVLYLENSIANQAFTSERVELLKLLCSQAAISLENARLYQKSQTYTKQLEQSVEKLQLSEARYRYLATATSQIIWLASPEGENLDTVHWMAYTGQTDAEVKGTGWLSALHPDDIEHTTKVWLQAVEKKSLYQTEYRIRGADGIYRYFAVRGVPLLAEDGSVKEWIGTCNDIDARRRAEDRLRQKSQQLEQTLQELQTMQLQLVQNEKMSALGNLVAGVAHEINNPVGFLAGNIQPALDYIKDLLGLIDLYQEKYPQIDREIEDEIAAIDLEFVREDLPKLVGSMREGVDRIANISTSLRTFSRADSDTPVAFNLHEGIDSTILILKHRLKANENRPEIKIIKSYGEIPKVECFAGQLNQVFMNILANAIDALEESNAGRSFAEIQAYPNQITIRTFAEGNCIKIAIADNGKGMTAEVKSQIFDHLFTTKGVGKGTGLGLAIARQIVEEKHGGTIEVNSIVGEGAEFTISIPG